MKMKYTLLTTCLFFICAALVSCELFDPHKPPRVNFKTDAGYTYEDATVSKGATIKVGIIGEKVEDDMKTYNISYAYDGATATTTKETFTLSGSEQKHYDKDYEFTVRNQEGTEKWFFVITDRDGNITKLSLILTVQ